MFENLLNPIFNPLLKLGYFWAIIILSFLITLFITVVYKFATDQNLMKKLKDEMKGMQKEMKLLKDNPQKAMAHQKKIMEKNMQYMKHSFKPTLYTMIPIIIIFSWLNANLAFLPLEPGQEFGISVDFKPGTFGQVSLDSIPELTFLTSQTQEITRDQAVWRVQGEKGEYKLEVTFNNQKHEKIIIITDDRNYENPKELIKESDIISINIGNEPVKPLGKISLLGWKPGWLGTYILLSLIFSFSLRKIMGIS
jgi:uncharacterized membrane protein (DUF106 family)